MKHEGSAVNGCQDIEWKRSVTADGLLDRQMDWGKTICLPQVTGRHNDGQIFMPIFQIYIVLYVLHEKY